MRHVSLAADRQDEQAWPDGRYSKNGGLNQSTTIENGIERDSKAGSAVSQTRSGEVQGENFSVDQDQRATVQEFQVESPKLVRSRPKEKNPTFTSFEEYKAARREIQEKVKKIARLQCECNSVPCDAAELTADAMARVHRSHLRVPKARGQSAYLKRVVKSAFLDMQKKNGRNGVIDLSRLENKTITKHPARLVAGLNALAGVTERTPLGLVLDVQHALRMLPDHLAPARKVAYMRFRDRLEWNEVARSLGMTVDKAKHYQRSLFKYFKEQHASIGKDWLR